MKTLLPSNPDHQILETVISPRSPTFSRAGARALLKLSFTEEQLDEIHTLLDRNNAGTITPQERELLEGYSRVGNFLSLVQAKARTTLSSKPGRT